MLLNAGTDQMLVHYLEWSNQWVNVSDTFKDEGYLGWPTESSEVAVVNDQTMFTPGVINWNGILYYDEETQTEKYLNEIIGDAGNGSLTAGHLDLTKSYKTFGALG